MGSRDARIDAYIAKTAPFARPVLEQLRELVHGACPDVEEAIKWGMPAFMYRGMLCGMAAFKEHCTFGFWKGRLIVDAAGQPAEAAMGQFGRITSMKDLPPKKVLTGYIRQAMRLNEEGVRVPKRTPRSKPELAVPDDLARALRKNRAARETFEKFSPSNRREYVAWLLEAKADATRKRRLDTAIEWMAEGKPRNWKYMK